MRKRKDRTQAVKVLWIITGLLLCIMTGLGKETKAAELCTLRLWPGKPPHEENLKLPLERNLSTPSSRRVAGRPVIRIGNVSTPTLTVFTPPEEKQTGTAILVCPGGGYHILAWDLEGTEVCQRLNEMGITAILLKYRVPRRKERKPFEAPLEDAQRAMGLIRLHAREWGIRPDRIGVLGFSAGGHLAAVLSNQWAKRTYPEVDEADHYSCRPDFTVLIYPAYLVQAKGSLELSSEIAVTAQTPPAFMVMAANDPIGVENVLVYGAALHRVHIPFELHVYPQGGHGFGLRPTDKPITHWPDLLKAWLYTQGWLSKE